MSTQPCEGETSPYETPGGVPLFSKKVIDRLTATLADCCLVSCDGERYPVHKAKLLEQSKVLRGLLSTVESTAELPLAEDAATVRMLISGMYDANNIITWSTANSLFELANKYDVEDIQLNCERFLIPEPLSTSDLPKYMQLACAYGIKSTVKRYQNFVAADDNFENLTRAHGADWCKDLPGDVVTEIMTRRLNQLKQRKYQEDMEKDTQYNQLRQYAQDLEHKLDIIARSNYRRLAM